MITLFADDYTLNYLLPASSHPTYQAEEVAVMEAAAALCVYTADRRQQSTACRYAWIHEGVDP